MVYSNLNYNNNNSYGARHDAEEFQVLVDLIQRFDEVIFILWLCSLNMGIFNCSTSFQLFRDDRFSDVDKIKSYGATYVVAVGLAPEKPIQVCVTRCNNIFHTSVLPMLDVVLKGKIESIGQSLVQIVEFVLSMKEKLKMFNAERQKHFQLRAGE